MRLACPFLSGCFNTQPPEGGWEFDDIILPEADSFNTQPPEGGWQFFLTLYKLPQVSTHSRLKAAGVVAYFPA